MVHFERIRLQRAGASRTGVIFDKARLLNAWRSARTFLSTGPQLIGGDDLDIDERWRLLDALYDVKPTLFATAAIFGVSLILWNRQLSSVAGLWMATSLMLLGARFFLSRAYVSRSSSDPIRTWMNNFYIAVALTGLQWGLGGLLLVQTKDGAACSAVFAVETALMAGAAVRGYSFPIATITQVNLTVFVIGIFFLVGHQYTLFSLLLLYCLHQTSFIFTLAEIKLKEIHSEQQRFVLMQRLSRTNDELASANTKLHEIATTDALTQIANRRSFECELERRWEKARRTGSVLSLLLIDVDHFKRFNDAYGHQSGDECLALVAGALRSVTRNASDHPARYGGEEFALILPDSDLAAAQAIAERLMTAVRAIMVPVVTDMVHVTVSIGVGSLRPDATMKDAMLISLADQALYRAKQDGRDRICSSSIEP